MTPEEQDILKDFERGRRLHTLTSSESWPDVLDILETLAQQAEFNLINLRAGQDPLLLRDLHTHARAARTILEQFQIRVSDIIERGRELPQEADKQFETIYANI